MRIRGSKFGQVAVYGKAISGGAYVGPGDIVSGASLWYGLRGYSAAYSTGSNPAIDLVDQAGANALTGVKILSDGTLDVASIATWVAAHSVTTIKVSKIYDQISTNHAVQATLSAMPTLVLGPVTGLATNRPAMVYTGSSSQQMISGSVLTLAQPSSFTGVAITTTGGSNQGIICGAVTGPEMRFGSGANNVFVYAGSATVNQTQTDNAWHALQGVVNGASSVMNVDGTSGTTGNPGTNSLANNIVIGNSPFATFLTGMINESGIYPVALSGTNMTNLSSNQHSYWGF